MSLTGVRAAVLRIRRAWLVVAVMLLAGAVSLGVAPVALAVSPGSVIAWGINGSGELGDGTTAGPQDCGTVGPCSTTPVAVSGLSTAIAIAGGAYHSLAVLSSGAVMAWGDNSYGELGDGTSTERDAPVAVSGVSGASAVTAGAQSSLALLSNGTVMAWGLNTSGQLGDGTTTNRHTPVAVGGLSGVTAIAAGADHSLALLSSGTVMAWGANSGGQLGDGTTTNRHTPVAVGGLTGVTAIAAGNGHSLALLSNGTVMAWGGNASGQLGDGTTTDRLTPVAVGGLTGVTAIAAGRDHSLALLSNGTATAWGANDSGQVGDGTSTDRHTPVAVSGLSGVSAIAAGAEHSLALLANGTVMAWGANFYGQLGDGTINERHTPVPVSGLTGVGALAPEQQASHTLVIEERTFASVSPTTLAFGWQPVGSASAPQSLTFTNAGPLSLAVSGEALTGVGAGAYDKTTDGCAGTVLSAGASCQVSFRFAPSGPGAAAALLTVTSNAANTPAPVVLSGTGLAPPAIFSPPAISGQAMVDQTLTEAHGVWSNNPTAYVYQWQRCDNAGNACSAIPGAGAQTYMLLSSDVGHTIRVQETASNTAGASAPATSRPTAVVAGVPASVSPPSISGQAVQGEKLTEAHASWTNSPTGYAYQWQRCNGTGSACAAITGATGQSYTLSASDVASTIRVLETASNSAGASVPAGSKPTALVTTPGAPRVTRLRLTRLRLTTNPFVVGRARTPIFGLAATFRRHKHGTRFKFTLSEAATVKIVISGRLPGRRHGKSCVAPSEKRRHAKRCMRVLRHGTLIRLSHQGANTVNFSGRIRSRALRPGHYQVTLTATDDAKRTSKPRIIYFTIVAY